MPYAVKGKTVYKRVNGLKKKAKAKSPARAKKMVRLLRGVAHGWKPTRKPGKR